MRPLVAESRLIRPLAACRPTGGSRPAHSLCSDHRGPKRRRPPLMGVRRRTPDPRHTRRAVTTVRTGANRPNRSSRPHSPMARHDLPLGRMGSAAVRPPSPRVQTLGAQEIRAAGAAPAEDGPAPRPRRSAHPGPGRDHAPFGPPARTRARSQPTQAKPHGRGRATLVDARPSRAPCPSITGKSAPGNVAR